MKVISKTLATDTHLLVYTAQEKSMDIEKLLARAADYCDMASNQPPRYLLEERIAFAQIAGACANVAHAMIEYERWQEERFRAERDEMLAQRKDESPF